MSRLLLFGLLFVALLVTINAINCPCWHEDYQCPSVQPSEDCTPVDDACGCCKVCEPREGEECGPWWIGYCEAGLECVFPLQDPENWNLYGTCEPIPTHKDM